MTAKRMLNETHWANWIVANLNGLHARPAALLVRLASTFDAEITIECDHQESNAKSILGLLALGAAHGASVTIRAEGPDAAKAVKKIGALFAHAFHEETGGLAASPRRLDRHHPVCAPQIAPAPAAG